MENLVKFLALLLAVGLALIFVHPSLGLVIAAVSIVSMGTIFLLGLFGFWVVDKVGQKKARRSSGVVWIARIFLIIGLIAPPANGYKSLLLLAVYFAFVHWYKRRQGSASQQTESVD